MPEQVTWPSEQVVLAAQAGDARAISILLSSSHPHVRRFARTLCATPQDAEEAAQEALIILYRKVGTLRVAAALASWMYEIVRHECVRRMRLAIRRPAPSAEPEPSAEETALLQLEAERVVACVANLPPEQRAVLVLRDLRGLSGAETAQTLGLERAAMKSRLHRAREAVRAELRTPLEGASATNSAA